MEFRGERLLEGVRAIWLIVCCVQKLWGIEWKAKFQYPLGNRVDGGMPRLCMVTLSAGLM